MKNETQYVSRVGVEMEGAFASDTPNMDDDGSLEFDTDREEAILDRRNLEVGEIRSEPESDLKKLKDWIKTYYPN